MRYKCFNELIDTLKSKTHISRCAVVGANDEQTIEAIVMAKESGIVSPILIGDELKIKDMLTKCNQNSEQYHIISCDNTDDSAQIAVDLVNSQQADCIMKGLIETGHLMHCVMKKENGMRTGSLISALSVMETPFYHKLLFLSDAGICMYPNLEQKKGIIENAVDAMTKMGIDNPKVAVLCAVEYLNPKMPETVDAAKLKEMNLSGEINDCIIEGPISYDVAMYKHAADQKGFESPVAGDPDLLIWPDIAAGNIAAKILDHSCGGKGGGLLIGTKVPIILTSRGDTAEGKYRCIALGAAFTK